MQHMAPHNMGLLVPLFSLLLIAGGGARGHGRFADAAATTAQKSETPTAYWEAVLPRIPMPLAISDLLARHNVFASQDHDVTISPNNLKFVKGLRKMGPNNEKVRSEPDHGDKHVHIAPQVEDDLNEISVSYGSQGEEDIKKGILLHKTKVHKDLKRPSMSHESQVKEEVEKVFATHKTKTEENLKEISVSYGLEGERVMKKVTPDLKKILAAYRPQKQENLREISVSYGSEGGKDLKEISVSYGLEGKKDLKEISVSYGLEDKDVLKEISVSYGVEGGESVKEISTSYGVEEKDVLKEISMSYGVEGGESAKEISMSYGAEQNKNPMEVMVSGTEQDGNLKEISVSYGSAQGKDVNQGEEDPNKATMSYESEHEEDPHKATMSYGSEHEDDPNKATMSYGSEQEEDPHKATMSYGSEQEDDPHKATMSYGLEHGDDPHKLTMSYGSQHEDDMRNSTGHETHIAGEGGHHHHHHVHSDSNRRQQADVFFFHDTLRPGSIITPTIPPTTSLPALLPRHVADSIPFSTKRLSDIVAMFAPASLPMTREIRWTLDTCEHPRTVPGQKAGCATSLESLAELPASLLGTRNVRAFSAADLPVEASGTRALRGRYNVTAMRKLSGESSEIVTCHDLTYPYAVYYCHTANPTAAYSVTLARVEDGAGTPPTIEALAVCHLDTSKWSPKNPFFELHNLKPGEVTVCHFLTKLSIIWVPGGGKLQEGAHAATR